MKSFKTRAETVAYYKQVGEETFNKEISSLAVKGSTIKQPLYHLSFSDKLGGKKLKPQVTTSLGNKRKDDDEITFYTELCPARLSCSDTIDGCYYALFFIIDELLYKQYKKVDELVASLYTVDVKPDTRILTNDTINDYHLIHDSHITREYGIVSDFTMTYQGDIYFKALWDMKAEDGVWYYPFDDKRYPKKFASLPMVINRHTLPFEI